MKRTICPRRSGRVRTATRTHNSAPNTAERIMRPRRRSGKIRSEPTCRRSGSRRCTVSGGVTQYQEEYPDRQETEEG